MSVNILTILVPSLCVYFGFSILAWKQPGCDDNPYVDVFYNTVATRPSERRPNWLCEEPFEFRVNVCSFMYKTHLLRKFDSETMKIRKHPDNVQNQECSPHKMRFQDNEKPPLDIRVDVRMFRCPVKFMVKDPNTGLDVARDFLITKGNANMTVALLLTSAETSSRLNNICLEDIFLYENMGINLSDFKTTESYFVEDDQQMSTSMEFS